MRIESVTAHSFGPLTGATLELAPGLTVVAGPNESAKSSWHAATYAALCGRQRKPGRPKPAEQRFVERHQPWRGDAWRVSAIVELADGRRVELTQDLLGKVDCRAVDLTLGRDISNEIMVAGAPDASKWLGLDRRSFAATACVRQADVLGVLGDPGVLQGHLQRAAATGGTDATAAAALQYIDDFHREHVGTERVNAVKPLRTAQKRLADAEEQLVRARNAHVEYLVLVERSEKLRLEAELGAHRVVQADEVVASLTHLAEAWRSWNEALAEASRAEQAAVAHGARLEEHATRLERIRELHERFDGVAPPTPTEQDDLVAQAEQAQAAWRAAPSPRTLDGPTADDLRAELEALPPRPTGDIAVHEHVRASADAYLAALAVAEAHRSKEPDTLAEPAPSLRTGQAIGPDALRRLATEVASADATPEVDPRPLAEDVEQARRRQAEAVTAVGEAQRRADDAGRRHEASAPGRPSDGATRRPVLLALSAVLLVGALVALAVGSPVAAVVVVVLAVLCGGAGFARRQAPPPVDVEAVAGAERARTDAENVRRSLHEAEHVLATAEARHAAAVEQRERNDRVWTDLVARCEELGLSPDPHGLSALAEHVEQLDRAHAAAGDWRAEDERLRGHVDHAAGALAEALRQRGADVADDVRRSFEEYEVRCATNARQAGAAARRDALERSLSDRVAVEAAVREAAEARSRAVRSLRGTARAIGLLVTDDAEAEALSTAIARWREDRDRQAAEAHRNHADWLVLTELLGGSDLAALEDDVLALREQDGTLRKSAREALDAADQARLRCETSAAACSVRLDEVTDVGAAVEAAKASAADARTEAAELAAEADQAEGALVERARALPGVAEAEEEVDAARSALDDVERLARILDSTRAHLARAQEAVHRDIAPVLVDTLREWLPTITDGRYVDATLDPATLSVQVCGPSREWRNAGVLSVGTAEQVHLLLRIALVKHLTAANEVSPLLLDDVTVQADDTRTRAVLDLLLALADRQQIVLFAQESSVLD
ncbi:AAA family ATPase, partial [Saccharothrix sp. MB29]|nr:AAA family ATPase [Saccharothrix sp. MB29]